MRQVTSSRLTHLECPECGIRYDADTVHGLCHCGSPLFARYDLTAAAAAVTPADIAARAPTLWRYRELLPVRDPAYIISLGEGMTPLLPLRRLGKRYDLPGLLMKDDGLLPTGTFKARGAAVAVSRAAELGVRAAAMPTNGNAGAAWAAYAARAGIRMLVAMPVDAPAITRAEIRAAGAELYLVRGLISDAGRLIAAAVAERGGYHDVATLKEPYRVEGKKTMGFEIAEQLGWRMPDVVVYPTGGGVGVIGIYKALLELRDLGWVSGDLPRMVAVQSSGCAPIVRAYDAGQRRVQPWTPDAHTVAFGINVPAPLGGPLVLDAVRDSGGCALAVPDEKALAAQRECARLEGALVCPEGGAALAAVHRLRADGWLGRDDEIVVLNTGTGIKYPDTLDGDAPTLSPDGAIPAG
jgi:threonine synthase